MDRKAREQNLFDWSIEGGVTPRSFPGVSKLLQGAKYSKLGVNNQNLSGTLPQHDLPVTILFIGCTLPNMKRYNNTQSIIQEYMNTKD